MILRRLDGSRFSEVLRNWERETVVIIGGGPSVTTGAVRLVEIAHKEERVKCIAVNDAYLLAPWADVQYAADSHWHGWHTKGIDKPVLKLKADEVKNLWSKFAGQKCTIENSGANVQDDAVHMLRNKTGVGTHRSGLSTDPRALMTGRNSGFQAINLSTLAGASTIILLGFDAREGQPLTHWHGGHPRPTPIQAFESFRRSFSAAQKDFSETDVRIINCSMKSAINTFEKIQLEEALELEKTR